MATSVTVRHLSDGTITELAARAAAQGQSLQEFLRSHLTELAARPDVRGWTAQVETRLAATGRPIPSHRILAERDLDRR